MSKLPRIEDLDTFEEKVGEELSPHENTNTSKEDEKES